MKSFFRLFSSIILLMGIFAATTEVFSEENYLVPGGAHIVDAVLPVNALRGMGLPENKTVVVEKKIRIDLSDQTLSLLENDRVVKMFRISSGKRGLATPQGEFQILEKKSRAYSAAYGLFMPYWMAFTTLGHGIHELPEWPSGYKEGEDHLGTPVSHGCIRLGVDAAKETYGWSDVGTRVEIGE